MKFILKIFAILLFLFSAKCPYCFAQNNDDSKSEEWEEFVKIFEQAEAYQAELQSKILTLNDLECTYWVPANSIDENIIPWNFAFFNKNIVLLFNSYNSVSIYPSHLIQYYIRDNIIYFTESLTCYLDKTYLYIGDEKSGYIKYKLHSVFPFLE